MLLAWKVQRGRAEVGGLPSGPDNFRTPPVMRPHAQEDGPRCGSKTVASSLPSAQRGVRG